MLSERRSGLSESLWRAGFGAWLFGQFALSVWPAEGALRPLGALGMLAALGLALGWRDRAAALLLALLWALRPIAPDPWFCDWTVVVLLLAQAALPPGPYGSLRARGRVDPDGGWSMPDAILRLRFAALFAFGLYVLYPRNAFLLDAQHAPRAEELGAGLLLAGVAAGAFAFVVHERALGWIWLVFLAAAIATGFEPGKQGSREFLWLALAANFQPGWFPARAGGGIDCIFYDGGCALCHGFVRFVLAEDPAGARFRFAPLESATLRAAVAEAERARLPDSIVVRTARGELLVRSRAVRHVLIRLGGWWRLGAELARVVPTPVSDLAYSAVAAVRKRIFGTKTDACPLLPRHLRARFDS